MTQDELYRMPSDRCIVLVKGHKPFYDYKINPDHCLNFSSDLFTVKGANGRKLKKELLWPVNDKDPEHPARKRTSESYREGLQNAKKAEDEQKLRRREEMAEDQKYDFSEKEPLVPDGIPVRDFLSQLHGNSTEHSVQKG